jgi:molybdopterin converting factor small subunit
MDSKEIEVQVLLFASARECAGRAHLPQALPAGTTVRDLVARLYETYPGLRDLRLSFAVNAAYAGLETELHDGDEVACIPPVGGG